MRDKLSHDPIQLDSEHWLYQEPFGLQLYCDRNGRAAYCGTIPITTVLAYVKRWKEAREMP
jgi:hypothetical protein